MRFWGLAFGAGTVALLAAMHLASVSSDFRLVAGLHRWLMTYAEGFHRRGMVGTLFQSLVGGEPRDAQIALASQISAAGTFLWLGAAFALIVFAAARIKDRALMGATLAFGALALINPMWTTRAHDNGYLDWLVGLAVAGALAAFVFRRPVLSGVLAAVGILAYWGTIFVWLPLGFLIACLLLRDAPAHGAAGICGLDRVRAACREREIFALLLPPATALLTALFHDNDAAVAQLTRIGGQEHIIEQTFSGVGGAMANQVETLLLNWRAYLGVAAVYVFPPALCAALWAVALRRLGRVMFQLAWLDTTAAVLATLAPLSFLLIAFDLSRLMAWSYSALLVVAVFWLVLARPAPEARRRAVWPWTVTPVVLAGFFWTAPTIYAWADLSHLIPCERFCFKERTPQGHALDWFRRQTIASPIRGYAAPGGLLPGTTGHNEKNEDDGIWHRVGRPGRDKPGNLMDLDFLLGQPVEGVILQAPAQTKNAIIGNGPHRISIRYRTGGTNTANAETRFLIYNRTFQDVTQVLRARLPPSEAEFTATFTPPPELAGNVFRWMIRYNGTGVFDLERVSLTRVDSEE